MSGLVLPALMANRFDIMELNPGARQDWAMNPSLNSALDKNMMDSYILFYYPLLTRHTTASLLSFHDGMLRR